MIDRCRSNLRRPLFGGQIRPIRAQAVWFAAVMALIAGCSEPEPVEIPDLSGMAIPEARELFDDLPLELDEVDASGENRSVFSAGNWNVSEQDPAAGTSAERRSTVTVRIVNDRDQDDVQAAESDEPDAEPDETESPQDEPEPETGPSTFDDALADVVGDRLDTYSVDGDIGFVHFDAGENLTVGMIRSGIERDFADLVRAAFHEPGSQLALLHLTARLPLTDEFGNETVRDVYGISVDRDTAERINWDNEFSIDWPRVWDTRFLHPVFD